jgi:hypothetical protein
VRLCFRMVHLSGSWLCQEEEGFTSIKRITRLPVRCQTEAESKLLLSHLLP